MNDHDYRSLLAALNNAVEILHRNRRPDPAFVTAYDTLKQARAMLEKAVVSGSSDPANCTPENLFAA